MKAKTMKNDSQKLDTADKQPKDENLESQMTELMLAHLDEVEGGGAHNSWKKARHR